MKHLLFSISIIGSIINWSDEDVPNSGFGKITRVGIYSDGDLYQCVFQRNKIYNPRWTSNSWAKLHNPNASPDVVSNFHPDGPQAIYINYTSGENNVIRYNEFFSDNGNKYNDVIGGSTNASYTGFLGGDSDIYGNYVANAFDDAIEADGGNRNMRIWNNYIEDTYTAISNTPTSIDPLYIWRNVSGQSYRPPGSKFGQYGNFIKMGTSNSDNANWMNGNVYIFHNTIFQNSNGGFGGLGTRLNSDNFPSNRIIRHCYTQNNIFEVRDPNSINSISIRSGSDPNFDNNYDYDLLNANYPNGYEINGISNQVPTYNNPGFEFNTKTGNFFLTNNSYGFDNRIIIPNFSYVYNGNATDMGVYENGDLPLVYGINATTVEFPLDDTLYINEQNNTYNYQIYPNPANNILKISTNTNTVLTNYVIRNTLGQKVLSGTLNSNLEIKIDHLNSGIYFTEISNENQSITKQFIKK